MSCFCEADKFPRLREFLDHFPHILHGYVYQPILSFSGPRNVTNLDAAARTEQSFSKIEKHYETWLDYKKKEMDGQKEGHKVSASLAEIRALSSLYTVWGPNVHPQEKGPDFKICLPEKEIWIEVNAPQGRSQENRTQRELDTNLKEIAPFGFGDSVQAECVSKISSIKNNEGKQFSDKDLSILWLDFMDPELWRLRLTDSEQCLPIVKTDKSLTSGCLWNAFYAKEGDFVFDTLTDKESNCPPLVRLRFNGRFNRKTKIDFVIIDNYRDKIILQNFNSLKPIADDFIFGIRKLDCFSEDYSCLGTVVSEMKDYIENQRRLVDQALEIWACPKEWI